MKLVDVLKPEYIKIPLKGESKKEVINELIEKLSPYNIFENKDEVFSAILEREKIMTTGVGRDVAIPHCKKKDCRDFAIALGIHPKGVDFRSIDNKPAKIIFLLLGPEENPGMHIRLLSRISRLIAKETVRKDLLKITSPKEAYKLLKKEEQKYFEIAS
jgi:fructose-specific phosphotransferase system IIA component